MGKVKGSGRHSNAQETLRGDLMAEKRQSRQLETHLKKTWWWVWGLKQG